MRRIRTVKSLTRKFTRNRLKWAGYVERMLGERLMKRAGALTVEGEQEDKD